MVTIASIVIHGIFLKNERLKLIDQSLRDTAEALIDSKLGDLREIDFAESEKISAQELGESRIGKFFVIRNGEGQTIFESDNAKHLGRQIPQDEQWVLIQTKKNYIRVLNLKLPKFPDRSLQVGIVIDNDFITPKYFSKSSIIYIIVILIIGSFASVLLTSFLLQPLVYLDKFIAKVSDQVKRQSELDRIPKSMLGGSASKDEFRKMALGLNELIEKVNSNYRYSRIWAYQMAHELKTPLSILRLESEKIQEKKGLSNEEILPILEESNKVSETLNSFLSWAELENSGFKKKLFANRLGNLAQSICERFSLSNPNRIDLEIFSNSTIMADPHHMEQLISNLLSNALKYSDSTVVVQISDRTLTILDRGPGVPKDVIDRLGEPFNRGTIGRLVNGHGLGLAWVNSICRMYGWELGIFPSKSGTKIVVVFPNIDEKSTG